MNKSKQNFDNSLLFDYSSYWWTSDRRVWKWTCCWLLLSSRQVFAIRENAWSKLPRLFNTWLQTCVDSLFSTNCCREGSNSEEN